MQTQSNPLKFEDLCGNQTPKTDLRNFDSSISQTREKLQWAPPKGKALLESPRVRLVPAPCTPCTLWISDQFKYA